MRAEVAAAFFDFDDVGSFLRAIARGEAPRPSDTRYGGSGRPREPLWSLELCRQFIALRHRLDPKGDDDNLAALV